MLDELRQIAIFAKTVDHGSFRGAAAALRLSPSVVSHHVRQLEERLGVALLYRSTRKLSLTADGERLLVAARAMTEAVEAGLQDISNETNLPTGILRVTVPALLSHAGLIDQFAQFALDYPQVQLSIDFSDARRDLIADGYDVAIRAGEMKDSALKAQILFQFERRLVASPRYLKSRPTPKSPSELSDWDWLELAPVWNQKLVFRKSRKRQSVTKNNFRISANNAQALSQLARAGAGLAVVPEYLADPLIRTGELKTVLSGWAVEPIKVFSVWPSNAPKDGLIKHFTNFLKTNQR
jgi:DNA-binding transcriptional LysR family regulator